MLRLILNPKQVLDLRTNRSQTNFKLICHLNPRVTQRHGKIRQRGNSSYPEAQFSLSQITRDSRIRLNSRLAPRISRSLDSPHSFGSYQASHSYLTFCTVFRRSRLRATLNTVLAKMRAGCDDRNGRCNEIPLINMVALATKLILFGIHSYMTLINFCLHVFEKPCHWQFKNNAHPGDRARWLYL